MSRERALFPANTFYEGYEMGKCAYRSKTGHRDLIAGVAAMIVGTRGIE